MPALDEADLPQTPEPILRRISVARADFDHAGPAQQLTKDPSAFFTQIDPETLDRFEKLFTQLAV